MKLFTLEDGETTWIAANNEQEAQRVYRDEYGLSDGDIDGAVVMVTVSPESVFVITDEVDAETEEPVTKTAVEVMAAMNGPGIVCSTADR